jgi:hypothetical protein
MQRYVVLLPLLGCNSHCYPHMQESGSILIATSSFLSTSRHPSHRPPNAGATTQGIATREESATPEESGTKRDAGTAPEKIAVNCSPALHATCS